MLIVDTMLLPIYQTNTSLNYHMAEEIKLNSNFLNSGGVFVVELES